MLCEKCKIREANIQYTEVINGAKTEHNFCAQCAKEMDFGYYTAIFDSDFPLGKLLSGLLGMEEPVQKKEKYHQIICPNCQTSYETFIHESQFGCTDCYSVFDLLISDNMKQLQGNDAHTGKIPHFQKTTFLEDDSSRNHTADILAKAAPPEGYKTAADEIRSWELRLKEALRKEEYETAALCRDKIKILKKGN